MAVYKWLLGAKYENNRHTGFLFVGWCVDLDISIRSKKWLLIVEVQGNVPRVEKMAHCISAINVMINVVGLAWWK